MSSRTWRRPPRASASSRRSPRSEDKGRKFSMLSRYDNKYLGWWLVRLFLLIVSQKSLPGSQGLLDTHPLPASTVPNHIAGRILRLAPAFALQLHFFKFCVQRIMLFASPSGLDGMGVWVDPIRISNQIPPGCNTTVLHPFKRFSSVFIQSRIWWKIERDLLFQYRPSSSQS